MTVPGAKIAVVSGGSSGIGLETVRHLLNAGCKVAFFGEHEESVAAAIESVRKERSDGKIYGAAADIRNRESIAGFFGSVRSILGPVNILVANAGYSPKSPTGRIPLSDIPLEEWNDVIAVNLTGALLCCQQALPDMVAANWGRIILVGSVAARTIPKLAGASYGASKSAMTSLARSIVSEYSGSGITANTVCPGRILTRMTGNADSPANARILQSIPVGRLGNPGDIARVIEFLTREESGFINGAVIDINGGQFSPP